MNYNSISSFCNSTLQDGGRFCGSIVECHGVFSDLTDGAAVPLRRRQKRTIHRRNKSERKSCQGLSVESESHVRFKTCC